MLPYTPSVTCGDTSPYTGEAYALPLLRMKFERVGRAAAPTLNNDSAYRPSSGRFAATFPQGKANLRGGGRLLHRLTVHPLRHLR